MGGLDAVRGRLHSTSLSRGNSSSITSFDSGGGFTAAGSVWGSPRVERTLEMEVSTTESEEATSGMSREEDEDFDVSEGVKWGRFTEVERREMGSSSSLDDDCRAMSFATASGFGFERDSGLGFGSGSGFGGGSEVGVLWMGGGLTGEAGSVSGVMVTGSLGADMMGSSSSSEESDSVDCSDCGGIICWVC